MILQVKLGHSCHAATSADGHFRKVFGLTVVVR